MMDTFETSIKCPSKSDFHRAESNKGSKERQGPTVGASFSVVSSLHRSVCEDRVDCKFFNGLYFLSLKKAGFTFCFKKDMCVQPDVMTVNP